MLGHMVLFRGYILGSRKKAPRNKSQMPFSPAEWAAFNRALYQRRPKADAGGEPAARLEKVG